MFKKILVPLDGSETAERALPLALALAPPSDGQLLLLQAVAPDNMLVADPHLLGNYALIWPDQSLKMAQTRATAYLQALQTSQSKAGLTLLTRVVDGDAADVIVDTARAEDTELIVMSSHGYSGFTLWLMGSVAERVLHQTPCPVLIVRAAATPRHILIPLDGSSLAEKTLPLAMALAERFGCRVTLLRATSPIADPQFDYLAKVELGMGLGEIDTAMQDAAETYLQSIAAAQLGRAEKISTTVIRNDHPARAILDYAQANGVDLIAMSTHGRTGVQRWVYGSVTEKVVRAANTCSMLIVRSA